MTPKHVAILILLIISSIVFAVLFFQSGGEERPPSPLPSLGDDVQPQNPEEPIETKTIALFFPSESDRLLHAEERLIRVSESSLEEIKQALQSLIKGSESGFVSPFPAETEVRGLYLTDDGIAYVDLSKEVDRPELYGAEAELLTIYSVVNTLTHNFKSVRRVFILIDGGQIETLGGHVDLSRALLPLTSLNAR